MGVLDTDSDAVGDKWGVGELTGVIVEVAVNACFINAVVVGSKVRGLTEGIAIGCVTATTVFECKDAQLPAIKLIIRQNPVR